MIVRFKEGWLARGQEGSLGEPKSTAPGLAN
jgi:hypothetical protein